MKSPKSTRESWHKLTAADVDLELAASSAEERTVYPAPRRTGFLDWEYSKGPSRRKAISVLTAPNFSARGMHLIYGRGDHFTKLSCGMNIFLRRGGCVFVRFYSPGLRTVYRTYELLGVKPPPLPERGKLLGDDCVPEVLRDLYEDWVNDCICYPDEIT